MESSAAVAVDPHAAASLSATIPDVRQATVIPAHPRKHLNALTTLRFVAAASVMFGHMAVIPSVFDIRAGLLERISTGYGVTFFFMLSGFILTYSYPVLERGAVRRFFVARIARILPMYYAAMLFLVALIVVKGNVVLDPVVIGLNLSFLQSWIPDPHYYGSFNPIAWSISTEFFFYLCFPFLMRNWRITWRRKLLGAFGLVIAMIALADWGLHYLPSSFSPLGFVYIHPLARLFEFTLGIAAAHIFRYVRQRVTVSRLLGTALELGVFGVFVLVTISTEAWFSGPARSPIGSGMWVWLQHDGMILPPMMLVIIVLALEVGWLSRLLAFAPFVLLGEISYSVYLTHFTMLGYFASHQDLFRVIPDALLWPTFVAVVVATSFVFWSLVEVPCRSWIVRWYDRRYGGRPDAAVARRPAVSYGSWAARLAANRPLRGVLVALVLFVGVGAVVHASLPPASDAALTRTTTGMQWAIQINGEDPTVKPLQLSRTTAPTVFGWAVDSVHHRPARSVLLTVDGTTDVEMHYGFAYEVLPRVLNDAHYLRASFVGTLPIAPLSPGDHVVTLRILPLDGSTYYESHTFGIIVV